MKHALPIGILLIAGILLAACGEKSPEKETTEQEKHTSVPVTEETAKETVDSIEEPDLPETDLGGYNFRVATKGTGDVHWKSKDIYAESSNGEPINDAVFHRNTILCERYHFNITEIPAANSGSLSRDVLKSVQADEDMFDMAAIGLTGDFSSLVTKNALLDLTEVPNMDLSRPWYDQNFNKQTSIAGKLYATTGDMIIMDDEATDGVLFNKPLAEELDLGDLYRTVSQGKWTVDLMRTCAKEAAKDLNGDGVHGDEDRWGSISEYSTIFANILAMGEHAVQKDEEDLPQFVLQNDRFYSAFEKAYALNADFDFCMFVGNLHGYANVWSDCIDRAFSEGRVLFYSAALVRVTVLRSMNIDFGILPMPKYDEAQEQYYSPITIGCSNSITIPTTVPDPATVGFIIEAMSALSRYTLTPAYYDTVVKGKGARDEESYAMLDLIFSNRVCDLGNMYDWGGMISAIGNLTESRSPDIASTVESLMTSSEKGLQKTLDAILDSNH